MTTNVVGMLILPLAEQEDADGVRIDPAGVSFDPDRWYSVTQEFDHRNPPVGRAKLVRTADGGIEAHAELFVPVGGKFAFGGFTEVFEDGLVETAEVLEIGLTAKHVDPNQPEIEVVE